MPSTFTSLRTAGALTVGSILTVVGVITGASFTAPDGSDTVINAPSGQDIVYQLAGTEYKRVTSVACTATGGLAKYDTCYLPSPLSTTGALHSISIQCGNVAKALVGGDVTFTKSALQATSGSVIMNNFTLGTGATFFRGSGSTIFWNPADKITYKTLTAPSGTLSSTRYDCVMRAEVEDIYGR